MAGSSASQSTSQSVSDTYIPEYSQTPFLQEYANHARAMSDTVYNQGMDIYNKNQGNIDGVMRDALSYASPQRIAVDMGMAEAGVQQGAERGRLSAERDLQSYGLDPSAGRYAALDSANRVMSAAAAAGAGNQQRMADQAAGNAMRQQAISASLQNANYMSSVNKDANAYLNTASQLKYPPLGRYSESSSQSTSGSVQTDPPQQQKSGGEQQPKQQSGGSGGGGGQPKQGGEQASREPAPAKPVPPNDPPPTKPGGGGGGGGKPKETPDEPIPGDPNVSPEVTTVPDPDAIPGDPNVSPEVTTVPDPDAIPGDPNVSPEVTTPYTQEPKPEPLVPADQDPLEDPLRNQTLVENTGYDPYAGTQMESLAGQQYDPVTGQPINDSTEGTSDTAGSLYGQDAQGGWTGDMGVTPASYDLPPTDQTQMWSDIGQGAPGQTYDSTYDTWTNPNQDQGTYDSPTDYVSGPYDFTGGQAPDYGVPGDTTDYGAQGDQTDYTDYGAQDDQTDYTDYGAQDDTTDYTDYGDDAYTDYSDPNYTDAGDFTDNTDYSDYSDNTDNTDYSDYSDSGGDEGARGGAVMRGPGRRARIMPPGVRPMPTGYRPRPMLRPRFAGGGPIPPQGTGMSLDAPPRPPGAAMRAPQPPQAPRPPRGAPMAAPGGPRPGPMGRGPQPMPGNFISANGMPPPTGMPQQRMAGGGQAGRTAEPTTGGFVSRSLSPSGGSTTDDVNARLNAGEFVIPKDIAAWKGKEFFYKLIAQARKQRSGGDQNSQKPQGTPTGYGRSRGMR